MSIFKRLVSDMRQAQKDCKLTQIGTKEEFDAIVRNQRLEKLVDDQLALMDNDAPFKNPLQLSIDE